MPVAINASANLAVQIPSGPAFSVAWNVNADAYDRATVTIPHDGSPHDVELQPSGGDHVLLLVLTSTDYSGKLTAKIGSDTFHVKSPQVISGSDIVNTISSTPNPITLTNSGAADVIVDVLVLRKAT
jgi:hypothetical protein